MADLEKFRSETRAWLEQNCPPEMRKPMTSDGDTFWGGYDSIIIDPDGHPWEIAYNPFWKLTADGGLRLQD